MASPLTESCADKEGNQHACCRYVMPRPEGQRCLLVASGGQTVARMRSGVQMARFPSALPGGSRHTQVSPHGPSAVVLHLLALCSGATPAGDFCLLDSHGSCSACKLVSPFSALSVIDPEYRYVSALTSVSAAAVARCLLHPGRDLPPAQPDILCHGHDVLEGVARPCCRALTDPSCMHVMLYNKRCHVRMLLDKHFSWRCEAGVMLRRATRCTTAMPSSGCSGWPASWRRRTQRRRAATTTASASWGCPPTMQRQVRIRMQPVMYPPCQLCAEQPPTHATGAGALVLVHVPLHTISARLFLCSCMQAA